MLVATDALVFSGLLAAAVASALVCAASQALGVAPRWDVAALAGSGVLVVYPLDRLRDVARDRERVPLRSAFVQRHRQPLIALVVFAAVSSVVLVRRFDAAVWFLCAGVLVAGVLHRRLKQIGRAKAIHVSLAWTFVVVGLPVLAERPFYTGRVSWVAAVVFCALFSNLVASNLAAKGQTTASSAEWPRAQGRRLAITSALLGTTIGLFGPLPTLAAVPFVMALALIRDKDEERYTQGVVDGALLLGGLVASGASWMTV